MNNQKGNNGKMPSEGKKNPSNDCNTTQSNQQSSSTCSNLQETTPTSANIPQQVSLVPGLVPGDFPIDQKEKNQIFQSHKSFIEIEHIAIYWITSIDNDCSSK